jgi:5' nucleotidase, deoxy (Pyrimidine), cytosolic type C protein (NT5C)
MKEVPNEGAAAALRKLGYHDAIGIRIVTNRLYVKYTREVSVRQTVQWLGNHGIPYWDICFIKAKGGVGAELYSEDSSSNIKSTSRLGKDVLIFTNSTTENVKS